MYLVQNALDFFCCFYLQSEKVLFLSQIFKLEIFMDLQLFGSPESDNHIFSRWSMRMCVCVPVISIIQKQIRVELSYLAFYICIICSCYLKATWNGRTESWKAYLNITVGPTVEYIWNIACSKDFELLFFNESFYNSSKVN